MYLLNYLAAHPPNLFHESEKFPIRANFILPPMSKNGNFC